MLANIRCLAFASLCALAVTAAKAATPVTYFFYARVTSTSGMSTPQVGSIVPISVTVDASFPALDGGPHYAHYHGGAGFNLPSPILSATINGQDRHGIFDDIYVDKNMEGVSSIELSSFSPGEFGFDIKFTSTITSAVGSLKIPRHIYPGNFQTAAFSTTANQVSFYSGTIVE